MNPYQSPTWTNEHLHKMPLWLKRCIATIAGLIVIAAFFDAIYMHKLSTRKSGQFFEGWKYKEIMRYWAEQEIFGPKEEEE